MKYVYTVETKIDGVIHCEALSVKHKVFMFAYLFQQNIDSVHENLFYFPHFVRRRIGF